MKFIKEESEAVKIEETFRIKQEDTEELTDVMALKEECEVLIEMEEKEQYDKHCDIITGETSFSCLQTEKTCSQNRAQKTGTKNNLTCFQCGKSFSRHGNLRVHMRIHTVESPFTCQQCGKSFDLLEKFKFHMANHTRKSHFTCQQCGKSFKQKGNFNNHMRIHTGEKPYTCPQCGKSFRQAGNLKSHIRIHTGEKPFICQQCGKCFTRRGILRDHMRPHTR